MILFLILQFTISDVLDAYHSRDYDEAYRMAVAVPDTIGFHQDELTELRAMTAMSSGKYLKADSLFQIAIQSEYDSIRRKALTNYAELKHRTFDFDARIRLLKKAYEIEPTNQLKRIIARHYFQVSADYRKAEKWIDKHPDKEEAGYMLLLAEFSESQRRYDESLEYYRQAQKLSSEAGMFNYELFASEGIYRSKKLVEIKKSENFKFWLEKLILFIVVYGIVKYNLYKHDRANNVSS